MAVLKKKTSKSPAGSSNGNVPLWRLKDEERIKAIITKYPQLDKPITMLCQAFEVIDPPDARVVSGYVRSRIAAFSEERRSEHDAFKKQKRLERLEAREAKASIWRAELDVLRADLA